MIFRFLISLYQKTEMPVPLSMETGFFENFSTCRSSILNSTNQRSGNVLAILSHLRRCLKLSNNITCPRDRSTTLHFLLILNCFHLIWFHFTGSLNLTFTAFLISQNEDKSSNIEMNQNEKF